MKFNFAFPIVSALALLSVASSAHANPTNWAEYSETLLTKNPNCTDVALGHNIHNNRGSRHQSESNSRGSGGGGGISYAGFGIHGNGHSTNTNSDGSGNSWNQDQKIVQRGRKCDIMNQALSEAAQAHMANETHRHEANILENMNRNDNRTQRYIHRGLMQQQRLNRGFNLGYGSQPHYNSPHPYAVPDTSGHYGLQ